MELNSVNASSGVNPTAISTKTVKKIPSFKKDSFEGRKPFSEHLTFKHEKLFSPALLIEGSINDKVANLRKTHLSGIINRTSKIEGTLGDNPIEFEFKTGAQGIKFKGTYNDKDFDLDLKISLLKNGEFSGTIEGKEFSVKFPGEITDESKENTDLITLLASLAGQKITIKDARFGKLGMSDNAQRDLEDAMAAQMMQDQQMMQMNQMSMMNTGGSVPGFPPGAVSGF